MIESNGTPEDEIASVTAPVAAVVLEAVSGAAEAHIAQAAGTRAVKAAEGPVAKVASGRVTTLFPNLIPKDAIEAMKAFPLEAIARARYSGRVNYVVLESGALVVGRSGHTSLSQGAPVLAAGEARFINGLLRSLDNRSGHYRPSGADARSAAEAAFGRAGIDAVGKYIEKVF